MGYYEEQITVRCSIKFKIPDGFDLDNADSILPKGVECWDDFVYDEAMNTVYGEYTYKVYADCYSDMGDYWNPPTNIVEHFDEKKIGLRQDLLISEAHDIIE